MNSGNKELARMKVHKVRQILKRQMAKVDDQCFDISFNKSANIWQLNLKRFIIRENFKVKGNEVMLHALHEKKIFS